MSIQWPWTTIISQLKLVSAKLDVIESNQEKIMSEQSQEQAQVDAMAAEEQASVSAEEKFRADVEAFIAANPGAPNLSALQDAVDANKAEAASQTASDPSTPPA